MRGGLLSGLGVRCLPRDVAAGRRGVFLWVRGVLLVSVAPIGSHGAAPSVPSVLGSRLAPVLSFPSVPATLPVLPCPFLSFALPPRCVPSCGLLA